LADLPLTDILQIVSLSHRTGILAITSGDREASITFMNGNVVKASSSQNRVNLGYLLKRQGLISDKEETMALTRQRETGEPFGTILVQQNIVPKEKMEAILLDYIQAIVLEVLSWERGHFEFQLIPSPEALLPSGETELVLSQGVDTQHLIMEGLRLLDEKKHEAACQPAPGKGDVDFACLMADRPLSLSEAAASAALGGDQAEPHPLDSSPVSGGSLPRTDTPQELDFIEQLILEAGESFEPEMNLQPQRDISSLKSIVEELKGPGSLSEVLLLVLRYASEFFRRAVLFVAPKDEIRGFGQFGLDDRDHQINERIRRMVLPAEEDSLLSEALRSKVRVQGRLAASRRWDRYLLEHLGGGAPEESVVIPLISNNQTVALVYGDGGETAAPGDTEALEIFVIQAGMVLDRSHLEQRLQAMHGH
jgi:hypothetical protein